MKVNLYCKEINYKVLCEKDFSVIPRKDEYIHINQQRYIVENVIHFPDNDAFHKTKICLDIRESI